MAQRASTSARHRLEEEAAVRFRDRRHAGRLLAQKLAHHAGRKGRIVLALPRGGVPVAFEVARALGAPLDVLVVRKLGVPGREELAMGAITAGGARVLDRNLIARMGVSPQEIDEVEARERCELERRERAYRGDRPAPEVFGRTVLLVDDGAATGASLKAAILALRGRRPEAIVVAVPVAPASTARELSRLADETMCVSRPESFGAVGEFYEDFTPTCDAEVRELLARARSESQSIETAPAT